MKPIIDTSSFVRSHGRTPRGAGQWAFCTVDPRRSDYLDHVIWFTGLWRDARRDASKLTGYVVLYLCS